MTSHTSVNVNLTSLGCCTVYRTMSIPWIRFISQCKHETKLPNSKKLSPSWQPNGRSAIQGNPRGLWSPKSSLSHPKVLANLSLSWAR